jgi:SAM-dependent methyltransferase
MTLTAADFRFLSTPQGEALLAMDLPADPLAAQKLLRKHCDASQAAVVAELRDLRHRAGTSGRFPGDWARKLLTTDKLLQQASSIRLAIAMGRQLARRTGTKKVIDLCCGMGADTIGLAMAGFNVTAVDSSPEALLCAEYNAALAGVADRCQFEFANAESFPLPADAIVHVDPDRRSSGKRSAALADHSPGEEFLRALPARTAAGVIKLSPAFSYGALADWPNVNVEYVSEGGTCRQCNVWWDGQEGDDPGCHGLLASRAEHISPGGSRLASKPWHPNRLATVVTGDLLDPTVTSIEGGLASPAPVREHGPWLIEPDPAVIAADAVDDLAAAHDLWRIDSHLAWLFGNEPIDSPLAKCYHILATVPGRLKDIRRAIADLGGGTITIKPRGLRLDTDKLQHQLRGDGPRPLTILWTRLAKHQLAFIAEG